MTALKLSSTFVGATPPQMIPIKDGANTSRNIIKCTSFNRGGKNYTFMKIALFSHFVKLHQRKKNAFDGIRRRLTSELRKYFQIGQITLEVTPSVHIPVMNQHVCNCGVIKAVEETYHVVPAFQCYGPWKE